MNEIKEELFDKSYLAKFAQWGAERNLADISAYVSQLLKLVSEMGELADNMVKGRDIKDDIGDCAVVISILAKQRGLDPTQFVIIPSSTIEQYLGAFKNDYRCMLPALIDLYQQCIGDNMSWISINNYFIMLCAIAKAYGNDFTDCLAQAWNDIKDRAGVFRNGAFIKTSDMTDDDKAFAESLKGL